MAGQPRIPSGDKRRGRIHPGEFDAPKQGRKDRGPRGKAGAPAPPSAPIHDRKVVHATVKAKPGRHDPAGGNMPEQMVGGFKCKSCSWPGWREHRVVTKEGAQHATLAFAGCTNCGTLHATTVGVADRAIAVNAKTKVKKMADLTDVELLDVAKSIDSSETALTAEDLVGHRRNCPRGGNSQCGREQDGRCSLCKTQVADHDAIGKTLSELRALAGIRN
jgi:hypothetical protein